MRTGFLLPLLLVVLPAPSHALETFGGLGVGGPGAMGRLDLGWRLDPAWAIDVQLSASSALASEDLRLAAGVVARWTPVRWGPVTPHLSAGFVHAHELERGHLLAMPLHAITGADGHTGHRTGLGAGAGLDVSPLDDLPLTLGLRGALYTYLPDGRAPVTFELLAGLGCTF